MRFGNRLFGLWLAASGCSGFDARFSGLVSDAQTAQPIAGARVQMVVETCTRMSGILCLEFSSRTSAGPTKTDERGRFTLELASEKDVGLLSVAHPAYASTGTSAKDEKTKRTRNEVTFELHARTPEPPAVTRSAQAGARLVVSTAKKADGFIVLRVDGGGVAGAPEPRRLYAAGERLAQATVVQVLAAPVEPPAEDVVTQVPDAQGPAQSTLYVVHAVTAAGLYSSAVSLTWVP